LHSREVGWLVRVIRYAHSQGFNPREAVAHFLKGYHHHRIMEKDIIEAIGKMTDEEMDWFCANGRHIDRRIKRTTKREWLCYTRPDFYGSY
jgi:hypothetical protein